MVSDGPDERAEGGRNGLRRRFRLILCIAVSVVLLLPILAVVDATLLGATLELISPAYALVALGLYLCNLLVRGWRLKILGLSDENRDSVLDAVRLSALHQLLFTLLPSGSGDAGFPVLAKRITGSTTQAATRALIVFRIQDLWALAALACLGLLLWSSGPQLSNIVLPVGLLLALTGLYWAPSLTLSLGRFFLAFAPDPKKSLPSGWRERAIAWLRSLAMEFGRPLTPRQCVQGAWLTLLSWSFAAGSIWALFRMIGQDLQLGEVLIVIAGLNLVGAAAVFTLAGLGAAELGLAAILMLLGGDLTASAISALVVRISALGVVLLSSALVEAGYRATIGRFSATTRKF